MIYSLCLRLVGVCAYVSAAAVSRARYPFRLASIYCTAIVPCLSVSTTGAIPTPNPCCFVFPRLLDPVCKTKPHTAGITQAFL